MQPTTKSTLEASLKCPLTLYCVTTAVQRHSGGYRERTTSTAQAASTHTCSTGYTDCAARNTGSKHCLQLLFVVVAWCGQITSKKQKRAGWRHHPRAGKVGITHQRPHQATQVYTYVRDQSEPRVGVTCICIARRQHDAPRLQEHIVVPPAADPEGYRACQADQSKQCWRADLLLLT